MESPQLNRRTESSTQRREALARAVNNLSEAEVRAGIRPSAAIHAEDHVPEYRALGEGDEELAGRHRPDERDIRAGRNAALERVADGGNSERAIQRELATANSQYDELVKKREGKRSEKFAEEFDL